MPGIGFKPTWSITQVVVSGYIKYNVNHRIAFFSKIIFNTIFDILLLVPRLGFLRFGADYLIRWAAKLRKTCCFHLQDNRNLFHSYL
jgi:hypothetical protein